MKCSRWSHILSWGIRMNHIIETPKRWLMGLNQSHFWRLKNLVISTTKNKKILFLKIYEEMETKLSILVMKNVLVTCFFYKNLLNLYLSIFIFCVYISRYCYKLQVFVVLFKLTCYIFSLWRPENWSFWFTCHWTCVGIHWEVKLL